MVVLDTEMPRVIKDLSTKNVDLAIEANMHRDYFEMQASFAEDVRSVLSSILVSSSNLTTFAFLFLNCLLRATQTQNLQVLTVTETFLPDVRRHNLLVESMCYRMFFDNGLDVCNLGCMPPCKQLSDSPQQ